MNVQPRDPSRLRQGLNPLLTTSLAGTFHHNQVGSPLSAVSSNQYSTNQTPSSAMQPYNPQNWVASPAVGPERNHQYPSGVVEVSPPPPPPPYSPPRSSRPVSQHFESITPANTSLPRMPPTNHHRPSPDPPTNPPNPVFPPPPPGGRGGSRERSRFLPSLSRRKDKTPEPVPEPMPQITMARPVGPQLSIQIPPDANNIPPASRRAVSTPAIATPTSARSRSSSQIRWEPGMPVPPPPPGPPPPGSRSQSSSRAMEIPTMVTPPTRRPPPGGVTALGPVPPTPANWVEPGQEQHSQQHAQQHAQQHQQQYQQHHQYPQQRQLHGPHSPNRGLTVDTSSASSSNAGHDSLTSAASSTPSGGLGRSMALRGEKSLRQRRAESKSRQQSIDGALEGQLSDIVVPDEAGCGLTRRPTIGRNTPRTPRGSYDAQRAGASTGLDTPNDQQITPRAGTVASGSGLHPETPTPPFSPQPQKPYSVEPSPSIAPKALPTPPPQQHPHSRSQSRPGNSRSNSGDIYPHSPKVMKQIVVSQSADQFCQATIERFQGFAHREATATSDAEKVRMFAEFIVSESRIRRERHHQAIGAMGSEIFDLTRDLFRPIVSKRDSMASQGGEYTPKGAETSSRSNRNSMSGNAVAGPSGTNSGPPSGGIESPMSTPGTGSTSGAGNAQWGQAGYLPSLSPILSMSVSDNHDEADSRGRPASRWWETDSSGPSSMRLERSKRESKYMGVPREAWTEPEVGPSSYHDSSSNHASTVNEYPPEKVGWHESSDASSSVVTPQPLRFSTPAMPSPNTPNYSNSYQQEQPQHNTTNPHALDVSRLVTLPPPYPRHHPAVNNNHPTLTSTRTQVRTLSDFSEITATKARFNATATSLTTAHTAAAATRKTTLRTNLQAEITAGRMTYAEAASIEADSSAAELDALKELNKNTFDLFQRDVVTPLNTLLTGRIATATHLFTTLRAQLSEETAPDRENLDLPQSSGDETPELLEKLTLLKWIFEAREMLHREVYDILSDRNERYKTMIITPYQQQSPPDASADYPAAAGAAAIASPATATAAEKLRNAVAFFAADSAKRHLESVTAHHVRCTDFLSAIHSTIPSGVETQLSAFWDIAPPLKALLDQVPQDLAGFEVVVPAGEIEETESYKKHPLQYLYSLLLHAEKSTYQFIESQIDLLCLLHEVRGIEAAARQQVRQAEAAGPEGQGGEGRDWDGGEEERRRLDADLKEKVRVVGDQWHGALGEAFEGTKARVGEWLLQTGGWDESLEDGGVGAP